jgi:ankyrin repeat protein
MKTTPMDILRQLIEVHPDALVAQDNDGYTPLHCLCRLQDGHTTLDELRLFIQKNPVALQMRDQKGRRALQVTCEKGGMDLSLILELAQCSAEALVEQGSNGNTPLHWLCYHGRLTKEGLEALVEYNEELPFYSEQCGSNSIALCL